MKRVDLILLHPPSIHNFRELPIFHGPISDVIPSSSIFENYPIGFLTLSEYLNRQGMSVRIVNLALKMLMDATFDLTGFLAKLQPVAFGIDLHWLPHVDGSLSLAELLKQLHPNIPVIFGGLSATYYHQEIMRDYPCVDFIICGDSTEEPLHLLMKAIKTGGDYGILPNLVWRDPVGQVTVNGISYRPTDLDYVQFDYSHPLKMTMKYHDPSGYLPFRNWLANLVMAVFSCRGCVHDCASCGGSASSFTRLCQRQRPAFRSPELLARDIKGIARYTGAPVMVIGDLLQAGQDYAARFLQSMKKYRIENELALEFFHPPPVEEPERFGYRLFYRTLREHRQAMLMPTWQQRL
ncbi:MAG TPA: cobalamin-dependent protein, partial [Geobacteraceae bacterium]